MPLLATGVSGERQGTPTQDPDPLRPPGADSEGRFGVDADVGDTVVRFAGIRVEPHTFLDCLTAATFDHLNSRHPHSVAFGISSLAPDVWVAMTEEWPTDPVPLTCGSHRVNEGDCCGRAPKQNLPPAGCC